MQDVLERFETWAEREHKTITLSGKENVILLCDALWVSEAIGNIIKNALEHTEKRRPYRSKMEPVSFNDTN